MSETRKSGPASGAGPANAGPARRGLDQRRENREKLPRPTPVPALDLVPDGGLIAGAVRSGGAFDPLGCRSVDVARSDDVVACVDAHPGRWLMITLTVDRSAWLSPAACYQRVADRVREVARAVSLRGIHVTALELQGLTGDGWPHWHLIVWAPDGRSVSEIRAAVATAWRVRTDHVDAETGEVTVSRESIGFSRVDVARERQGVARYAAKYLLKPWEAVPAWMGESRRQLRKLRISSGVFDWLEGVGRHTRHRGGRRVALRRRRRARRLFDRMARSGLAHAVFRRQGDRLQFVRVLPVVAGPSGADFLLEAGAKAVRLGAWSRMRWTLDAESLARLESRAAQLVEDQRREFEQRRAMLAEGWRRMQWRREVENLLDA